MESVADDDPEGREEYAALQPLVEEYSAARRRFEEDVDAPRPKHADYLVRAGGRRTAVAIELYLVDMAADAAQQKLPARWNYPHTDRAVEEAFLRPPAQRGQKYVLLEKLGDGGAADVFLGRDNDLQRLVAIKVLNPMSAYDPNRRLEFERELQIAANLRHDNIVTIHSAEQYEDGKRYAVMQYIDGMTLKKRMANGPVPTGEVVNILVSVAEAIVYAQAQGLLAHRDLKPANILLDRSGKPHVADFGIALAVDTAADGVRVQGSKHYMAPEQFDRGADLSACDVWSIGVMMYELLAGRRPFEQRAGELIQAVRTAVPAPLDRSPTGASVDPVLAATCLRCLAKRPDERCHLNELIQVLGEWRKRNGKMADIKMTPAFAKARQKARQGRPDERQAVAHLEELRKKLLASGEVPPTLLPSDTGLGGVRCFVLGQGYRLSALHLGGPANVWLFLHFGSEADSEQWLFDHREHQWVLTKEGTLDFVRCSRHDPEDAPPLNPTANLPEQAYSSPLLVNLGPEQWGQLRLSGPAEQYARTVSAELLDRDQPFVAEQLRQVCGTGEEGRFLFDLLAMAHAGDWRGVHHRVALRAGGARVVQPDELARASGEPAASETFVSWQEGPDFPPGDDWAEWMLFLHPKQQEVARKVFSGPARLRGVSGSGKTCVIVHRAKHLALTHKKPVLVLTLTRPMAQLLEDLLRELTGPEIYYIRVMTVSEFANEVIRIGGTSAQRQRRRKYASDRILNDLCRNTVAGLLRSSAGEAPAFLRGLPGPRQWEFVRDEIKYVRGRLQPTEYDAYLSADTFERIGRGRRGGAAARRVILGVIRRFDVALLDGNLVDSESEVHDALAAAETPAARQFLATWRCVLVDEVQDLSQLEMTLLARLSAPDGTLLTVATDGLFLSGDGAQTIYKKGFRLIRSGIKVTGRSIAFTKNYRNTREVLTAAYELIRAYQYADVDEDNIATPLQPEYAARCGERPWVVECPTSEVEFRFVATYIHDLMANGRANSEPVRVAVIAASLPVREGVGRELDQLGLTNTEQYADLSAADGTVYLSTIEKAKGLEFTHVFLPGLAEGLLPRDEEMSEFGLSREAARLYVAMTRARDHLYLSYCTGNGETPSRFLTAIREVCDVYYYNGYLLSILDRE